MEGSQDAIIQAVSFPNVSVHMLELNRGHCTNIRNHGSRSYQAKPHSLGTAIKSTYTNRNPRLPQAWNFLSRDPASRLRRHRKLVQHKSLFPSPRSVHAPDPHGLDHRIPGSVRRLGSTESTSVTELVSMSVTELDWESGTELDW